MSIVHTAHSWQRSLEREIAISEVDAVVKAARGIVNAIPDGIKVPIYHRGITVVVAGGGVVVTVFRGRAKR